MARVTVEDCVEKVADRFELVALAAQRARNIAAGADLTIQRKGEKDTVIALREIGDAKIDPSSLRIELLRSFQNEKQEFEESFAAANDAQNIEADEEDLEIRRAIEEATEKNIGQSDEFADEDGFSETEIGDEE
jgi:DNA-directed RNA polymerase subunit omega